MVLKLYIFFRWGYYSINGQKTSSNWPITYNWWAITVHKVRPSSEMLVGESHENYSSILP